MTSELQSTEPARPFVIGIGEILWDLLPAGPAMGGAPANFTCHAAAFGAEALLISRVGRDEAGERLVQRLAGFGVRTDGISVDPRHPTGSVEVELREQGLPHFNILADVAWDHLEAAPALVGIMAKADAVCFGTLAQRSAVSAASIRTLLENAGPRTMRVLDLNLRVHPYPAATVMDLLELADGVKMNEDELALIARHLGLRGSMRDQLGQLVGQHALRWIACTLGPKGSILSDGKTWVEHPGCPVIPRDTVGAGDSFLAAVVLGVLAGWSLESISETANQVAAHVCTCDGAVPPLPAHLRDSFRSPSSVPSGH
jgi:fructokinase